MTAQLASAISAPDYYNCQMQPGLVKRQREICRQHPAAMRAISGISKKIFKRTFEILKSFKEGLRNAIDECHVQFQRVKRLFLILSLWIVSQKLELSKTFCKVLTRLFYFFRFVLWRIFCPERLC